MNEAECMTAAIEQARQAIAAGQAPFGAVIERAGQLVARARNSVWAHGDPTAHAEVNAIRAACRTLGTIDLSGCRIFTTCEPCPMCLAAAHWARINAVYFGAAIADARAAGFSELTIPASEMVRLGRSRLDVHPGLLADACRALFGQWLSTPTHRAY